MGDFDDRPATPIGGKDPEEPEKRERRQSRVPLEGGGSVLIDPDAWRERARRGVARMNEAMKARAFNAGGTIKDKAYEKTPDRLKHASDLQLRTRSGVIYFLVSFACVLAGGPVTALYLSLIAAICAGEFYHMMRQDAKLVNDVLGVCVAFCFPWAAYFRGAAGILCTSVVFLLICVLWYVFWQRARIVDVCLTYFGASYMGMTISCLVLLQSALEQPWEGLTALLVIASVWLSDVGAYLVGSRFGKHKMAPFISPKKSWEGFFGGIAASIFVWYVMGYMPGIDMSPVQSVAFGAICGCAGVLGDLIESRIKRNVGVKDSGTIMPGHGGLFDRTDSQFTAAVAAFALLVVGGCINFAW